MSDAAVYTISQHGSGWGVEHDGELTGPYETREAAFEAAIGPASNAIKLGYAVSITVEPGARHQAALGAD